MDNRLIIPVHSNKKGIAYCILDTSTDKYYYVEKNKDTIDLYNKLKEFKGTLYAIHRKYNVVGLVKDSKDKPKPFLYWVKLENLDDIKEYIVNYDKIDSLIDISDMSIDVFRGKFKPKVFSLTYRVTSSFNKVTEQEFIDSLTGQKQAEPEPKQAEPEPKQAEPEPKQAEPEPKQLETETKQLEPEPKQAEPEQKQAEPEQKQAEPEQKQAEQKQVTLKALLNAANTLNNITKEYEYLVNLYKNKINNTDDVKSLEVDEVIHSNKTDEDAIIDNIIKYDMYNTMLKLLKTNDTISIPKDYYNRLILLIKKNLQISMDGTRYDSIVKIRLNNSSQDNILARVEFDNNNSFVRITILKEFNSDIVSDDKIADYEIEYHKWRRLNSFI